MNSPITSTMTKQLVGNDGEVYATMDMGLATALVTAGYRIEHMTKEEKEGRYGSRTMTIFHFKKSSYLEETVKSWQDNSLILPLRSYWDNLKMVKSQVYSEKGQ